MLRSLGEDAEMLAAVSSCAVGVGEGWYIAVVLDPEHGGDICLFRLFLRNPIEG